MPIRGEGDHLPVDATLPRSEEAPTTFLEPLPLDIVLHEIWPLVMWSEIYLDNFRVCWELRWVCRAWRTFVEQQREWHLGWPAWIAFRDSQRDDVLDSWDLAPDADDFEVEMVVAEDEEGEEPVAPTLDMFP